MVEKTDNKNKKKSNFTGSRPWLWL